MIKLGAKVTDSITGFTGIVTARCEYLGGSVRVCVEMQELKDGRPAEQWFEEHRVTETGLPATRQE
jgi:hypothetical protein